MTSLHEDIFIETITSCRVVAINYEEFKHLSVNNNVLEKILNLMLLECMQSKEKREIELLSLDAKSRYERFIKSNPILVKKLTQYHIASYLGITPTQLSRIKKSTYVND